eukprot:gene4364-4617_t
MATAKMVHLKLQDATVEVERLGELFLINRDRMIATDKQRNATQAAGLETTMFELRAEQKRLVSLLQDKGATPDSLNDSLLRAMLQLKG